MVENRECVIRMDTLLTWALAGIAQGYIQNTILDSMEANKIKQVAQADTIKGNGNGSQKNTTTTQRGGKQGMTHEKHHERKKFEHGTKKPFKVVTLTKPFVDVKTAPDWEIIAAINQRIPLVGIHTIGTHPSPHVDEKAAVVALKETPQGRKLFPGIENALIAVITQTKLAEMRGTGFSGFIRALKAGVLLIGVGGSMFDEHQNREERVSCLKLVVDYLGIMADKKMRTVFYDLLQWINFEDNNGDNLLSAVVKANKTAIATAKGCNVEEVTAEEATLPKEVTGILRTMQPGMIAGVLKKGYETIDQTDDTQFLNVWNTGYNMIYFQVKQGLMFLDACDEYDTMKETIMANAVPISKDGTQRMLIVESDNPLMAKAVRRKNPDSGTKKVGILLIAKKTGKAVPGKPELVGRHFAIMPSPEFKDSMSDILKMLQQDIYKGCTQKFMNFKAIGKYGTTEEVPELYFDENQKIIMNGSKTDPDVGGLLDVEVQVKDIVHAVTTVTLKRFESYHAKKCTAGHCSKTGDNKFCSLFASCLTMCKQVQATTKPVETSQQGSHGKGNQHQKSNNQHQQRTGGNGNQQHGKQNK